MATSFDGDNLIITLNAGGANHTVDIETDVYSDWKVWVKIGTNSKYPPAFRTAAGDPLTPGIDSGGYFFIRNDLGWRIKPAEEDSTITVTGNLVPNDSSLPILIQTTGAFTVGVFGLQPITQAVDQVLATFDKQITDVQFLIETLRPHHTAQGSVYYWNPDTGSDSLDGTTRANAVATFAQAHSLATDGAHDVILALSEVSGQTVTTETIEITKNYLFLRGPGRDFRFKPTVTGVPTISINAVGVEVSGLVVDTAATGGQSAIEVQTGADFFFVDHCWSRDAQHAAVKVVGSVVYGRIDGCFFSHTVSEGIHINGDVRHTKITNTELDASGTSGIKIEGTTARNNIIGTGTKIYDSGTYGIEIVSPANRNFIDSDVSMYDNASGNVLDGGTNTVRESVWGELTADQSTTGTFGAKVLTVTKWLGLR